MTERVRGEEVVVVEESRGGGSERGPKQEDWTDFDADGLPDKWEEGEGSKAPPIVVFGGPLQYLQFVTQGYKYNDIVGWWQMDEENEIYWDGGQWWSSGSHVCEDRSVNNALLLSNNWGWGVRWSHAQSWGGDQQFGLGYVRLRLEGYLSNSNSFPYSNLGQWTFSVWVRINEEGEGGRVVATWRDPQGYGWELGVGEDGKAYGMFKGAGVLNSRNPGVTVLSNPQGTTLKKEKGQPAEWHHLVLTYEVGEGQEARLGVDGKLEASGVVQGNIGQVCAELALGKSGWGGEYWGAKIEEKDHGNDLDEARLYRKALDQYEWVLLPNWESDYTDNDGLSIGEEYAAGSDPWNPDTDGDGLKDGEDPSPIDAKGDFDGDGISDEDEIAMGLDPLNADSDGDGMKDGWEIEHGFNPQDASDGVQDADGDGLSNAQEFSQVSDPLDYYNGILPQMTIESGEHREGNAGEALGVVIKVSDQNGVALKNAPVEVLLEGGSGILKWQGQQAADLEVRTGADGLAHLEWVLGSQEFDQNQGKAKVESAGQSQEIQFDAYGVPSGVALSGLKGWWKAGEEWMVKDASGKISEWKGVTQATPNANQLDGSKRPEYELGGVENHQQWNGKGVVKFDGQSWLDFAPAPLATITGHTIVVVHRLTGYAKDGVGPFANVNLGGNWQSYGFDLSYRHSLPNTSNWVYQDGEIVGVGQQKTYTNAGASEAVKETLKGFTVPFGASLQLWKKEAAGVKFREGGAESEVVAGAGNGWGYNNGSQGWIGRAEEAMEGSIGEVMIWDRALNDEEIAGVEKYLKRWYGFEDQDGDGVLAKDELAQGTSDEEVDSNGDGAWDGVNFEFAYGYGANGELLWKPLNAADNDIDSDGLSNEEEYLLGTNAWWSDSDGDGIADGSDPYPLNATPGGGVGLADLVSIRKPNGAVILP